MRDISGKGRTAGNTRPFLTYIPKCIPAAAGFLFLTLTLMLSGCSSGNSLPAAPAVPETAAEAESSPAEREPEHQAGIGTFYQVEYEVGGLDGLAGVYAHLIFVLTVLEEVQVCLVVIGVVLYAG